VWEKLAIPNNLSHFNIHETDMPLITNEAIQLKGALEQNPIPFYENEINSVLGMLIKGENKVSLRPE
jgi:alcohol dehydrogenase class IV